MATTETSCESRRRDKTHLFDGSLNASDANVIVDVERLVDHGHYWSAAISVSRSSCSRSVSSSAIS